MEMLIDIEDGGVSVHVALPFDNRWVAAKLKELIEMCPELLEHQEAKDDIIKVLVAAAAAPEQYRGKLMNFRAVATRRFVGSDRVEKSHISVGWLLANIHGHVTTEWVYEALNDLYGVKTMVAIEAQLTQYQPFADRFDGHHRGLFLDGPKH